MATLARSIKPKNGNYQLILNTFLFYVGLYFVPTSGDSIPILHCCFQHEFTFAHESLADSTISIEQNIRGITEIPNFRPAAGAEKLKDFWHYYYVVTLNILLISLHHGNKGGIITYTGNCT